MSTKTPLTVVTSRPGHAYQQELKAGVHKVISDVSVVVGGSDQGQTPHELFLGALAACAAMTMQMVATKKKYDLTKVTISVYEELVDDPAGSGKKIPRVTEEIVVEGNLSQAELTDLENAARKCPVYKLFTNPDKQVVTTLAHANPAQANAPAQPAGQTPPATGSGSAGTGNTTSGK